MKAKTIMLFLALMLSVFAVRALAGVEYDENTYYGTLAGGATPVDNTNRRYNTLSVLRLVPPILAQATHSLGIELVTLTPPVMATTSSGDKAATLTPSVNDNNFFGRASGYSNTEGSHNTFSGYYSRLL